LSSIAPRQDFKIANAEWIAEDLACECRSIKGVKLNDLKDYGLVIYGAGVYAGMIAGLGKIKNWMERSPGKNLGGVCHRSDPSQGRLRGINFQDQLPQRRKQTSTLLLLPRRH